MEPLQPCWKELDRFIETDCEISKADLIRRCSWKVSYYAITMLKLMIFHSIKKDRSGQLIIID